METSKLSMLSFLLFTTAFICTHALSLLEQAESHEVLHWMLESRRYLHQRPELAFHEHGTSAFIQRQLEEMDIAYTIAGDTTGVIGVVGNGEHKVALRADMDALPIHELADVPFKSLHPGKMHACGHDAHVSMLLGAAKLLKAREADLPGQVLLVFQPAEEGGGGAKVLMELGLLEGVEAMFALHVWPSLPSRTLHTRPGPMMAASDRFTITLQGRGGHAAVPHMAADPVVAGSAVVMALQTLVSRQTSPTDGAVVSVTKFNTGPGAFNIIPDAVELAGTIRSLSHSTQDFLRTRVAEIAAGIAATYGCSIANITWSPVPYPPTINDQAMAALAEDVAIGLLGRSGFSRLEQPTMAAEDFSFYARHIPAVMVFLGSGNATLGTDVSVHSPHFQLDESVLPIGAAAHAAFAQAFLHKAAGSCTASS